MFLLFIPFFLPLFDLFKFIYNILAFAIIIFVRSSPRMFTVRSMSEMNLCAFDIFSKVIADI